VAAAREAYAAGVAATKASAGKSAAAIQALTDQSTRAGADAARIPPRNKRDSAPQNLFLGPRIYTLYTKCHKMREMLLGPRLTFWGHGSRAQVRWWWDEFSPAVTIGFAVAL
jgi:hypothetical protein